MLKKIPALRSLQSALGRLAASLPISPNQITVLALLLAIVAFCFAIIHQPFISLAFFILSGAADALDGAVARARKQVSNKGAYIDGMIDRLVEFLFLLSFAFYALPSFIMPTLLSLVLILFFGSAMTSFATAYAEHRHVADSRKIRAQPGILPRAERLILLFAALALVPFAPTASSFILACAAVLSFVTFLQRFLYFAA
jgi:archaetidylinositol phosphate synthase